MRIPHLNSTEPGAGQRLQPTQGDSHLETRPSGTLIFRSAATGSRFADSRAHTSMLGSTSAITDATPDSVRTPTDADDAFRGFPDPVSQHPPGKPGPPTPQPTQASSDRRGAYGYPWAPLLCFEAPVLPAQPDFYCRDLRRPGDISLSSAHLGGPLAHTWSYGVDWTYDATFGVLATNL